MAEQEQISLPIEYVVGDALPSQYVTELVVQHNQENFILSFFEIRPPILLGSADTRKAALENLDHIEAHCHARLVIPAGKMADFVRVMQENYERWAEHMASSGSEEDE
jgi:hypothetical protein